MQFVPTYVEADASVAGSAYGPVATISCAVEPARQHHMSGRVLRPPGRGGRVGTQKRQVGEVSPAVISPPPVAKRSGILTTLPKPMSVLAAAFSRAAGGSELSFRTGSGTVRIAAAASKMAPSSQCTVIRL